MDPTSQEGILPERSSEAALPGIDTSGSAEQHLDSDTHQKLSPEEQRAQEAREAIATLYAATANVQAAATPASELAPATQPDQGAKVDFPNTQTGPPSLGNVISIAVGFGSKKHKPSSGQEYDRAA